MKDRNKLILMLLSFLFVVSTMVFISCSGCNGADGGNDCIVYRHCKIDDDCKNEPGATVCIENKCMPNPCDYRTNICGLGKCIPHDNPNTEEVEDYYCQCDEGAEKENGSGCLLKCNSYEDCIDFKPYGDRVYPICSNTVDGGICNVGVCHGEDSCPKGNTCNEDLHECM
jgi:hypothetical protein